MPLRSWFKRLFQQTPPTPANPDLGKTISIRTAQLIPAILSLVLCLIVLSKIKYNQAIYVVVISPLTLLYILSLFITSFLNVLSPNWTLFIELFFGILWLVATALLSNDIPPNKEGDYIKSVIAFSTVLFISFLGVSGYVTYKSILPFTWKKFIKFTLNINKFQIGGIFFKRMIRNVFDEEIGYNNGAKVGVEYGTKVGVEIPGDKKCIGDLANCDKLVAAECDIVNGFCTKSICGCKLINDVFAKPIRNEPDVHIQVSGDYAKPIRNEPDVHIQGSGAYADKQLTSSSTDCDTGKFNKISPPSEV